MWSYYGSKSKIVDYYPPPKHPVIIEPFAGSARYALKYFDKDVFLIDKYPKVINIWKYLQNCSKADILGLPSVKPYTKILEQDFDCQEQFDLMSFLIVQGAFRGNRTVSKWGALRFENNKKNVANNLFKIKHWNFKCCDYKEAPDIVATWFIDPPYQFGGEKYAMSNRNINYADLKDWIFTRTGQVMVCENTKATWMSFMPIKENWGVKYKTTEAIWCNYETSFNVIQHKLL